MQKRNKHESICTHVCVCVCVCVCVIKRERGREGGKGRERDKDRNRGGKRDGDAGRKSGMETFYLSHCDHLELILSGKTEGHSCC